MKPASNYRFLFYSHDPLRCRHVRNAAKTHREGLDRDQRIVDPGTHGGAANNTERLWRL